MHNLKLQSQYSHWATSQWTDFIYSNAEHDIYLYKLICHIVKGERAWLERITGKEWNRDLWGIETKDVLLDLAEVNRLMAEDIFDRSLQERIHVERLNGQIYEPTIMIILQHTFFHGENHRGQLASFSARAGLKYPGLDYMSFCIINQL
jgi:uncharacterized damage-inducible protein DinB